MYESHIETFGETDGFLQSVRDSKICRYSQEESIDVKIKQLYTEAVTGGGVLQGRRPMVCVCTLLKLMHYIRP